MPHNNKIKTTIRTRTVYLLLLSITLLTSCDIPYTIKLDGKSKYRIPTECGRLEVSCKGLMGYNYRLKIKAIDGEFDIHTDSLKIWAHPQMAFSGAGFIMDKNAVSGYITLKRKEELECIFSTFPKDFENFDPELYQVVILPCNFIMCNNKPLINDTIRIR